MLTFRRAKALPDAVTVPLGLGRSTPKTRPVRRAEALPDAVAAPLGLGVNLPAVRPAPEGLPRIEAGFSPAEPICRSASVALHPERERRLLAISSNEGITSVPPTSWLASG